MSVWTVLLAFAVVFTLSMAAFFLWIAAMLLVDWWVSRHEHP